MLISHPKFKESHSDLADGGSPMASQVALERVYLYRSLYTRELFQSSNLLTDLLTE